MTLDDYLSLSLRLPWRWGGDGGQDCCFFAGGWVLAATGRDPLSVCRGSYSDALGARRLIEARGGLAKLVGEEMGRCGFVRTERPEHGDIAVIEIPLRGELSVARASVVIMNGPWWVGRALDGLVGMNAEPQAAWAVLR